MTWMWAIWFSVTIGLFGVFEIYALRHRDRQWTLSRTMVWIGKKCPLTIALVGALFGGLLIHFYAPWCPVFGG
jgi:hypothetical protein